ncbi:hypothetical protein EJB05_45362, partial [Eragrostis curvula]
MCSTLVPKTTVAAIERRRRAFLWTGEDKCSGARCLIAWDRVTLAKIEGGLGVKDLETQNHCLLLEFIHKIFNGDDAPWPDWLLRDLRHDFGSDLPTDSYLSRFVDAELSRYRSLTRVEVHDGTSTSFWFDDWNIIAPAENVCPKCAGVPEDSLHLFCLCPPAAATWAALNIDITPSFIMDPWRARHPPHLPSRVWPDVLLALLWRIWTGRNNRIFHAIDDDAAAIIRNTVADLSLWRH